MKTKYEEPHVEVIACNQADIIVTSNGVQWKNDWTDALKQF